MSRVVSNVSHVTLALPITKRVTRRSNRSNERRKQKREIGRRQTGMDWSRTIGLYERSLRDMNSAAFADGWAWYRRPEFSCSVVSSRDESDWYWRLSVLCEIFEKSARWNTRYPIENEYVALKARPRLRVLQIQRILSWSWGNVWKPAADEIADIPPITTSVILYGTVLSFSFDEKKKNCNIASKPRWLRID